MKLTLIRHIKTIAPEGMCYGQTDVPLPAGYNKIHSQIAHSLKNENFDYIYASPLQRCALLAKHIATNMEVIYDERLKEINFGEWENKMWEDIDSSPEAYHFFKDYINVAPPKGESFKETITRITEFMNNIKMRHLHNNILIVTHGGPIRIIQGIINKLPLEDFFKIDVPYGNISKLQF